MFLASAKPEALAQIFLLPSGKRSITLGTISTILPDSFFRQAEAFQ